MRKCMLALTLVLGCVAAAGAFDTETTAKALDTTLSEYSLAGTFIEGIAQLETLTGVKIEPDWRGLKAAGVEPEMKVDLRGKDTKFRDVIDLLLSQVMKPGRPLGWFADENGKVYVTTQARVLARRAAVAPSRRGGSGAAISRSAPRSRPKPFGEIRFQDTRLEEVIETFRKLTGVNFFVNWRALETVDVTRDTPVSFQARNITFARALDLAMQGLNGNKNRMNSVYWVVDDGVVHVSTGSALDDIMRTRVIDVTDLLAVTPNFNSRRISTDVVGQTTGTGTQTGGTAGQSGDQGIFEEEEGGDEKEEGKEPTPAELREQQRSQIVEIVKNSIGQDMWHPNGKGTITLYKNQLVITQSLLGWKLMDIAAQR